MIGAWLGAFVFTQAVEVPVWMAALGRRRAGQGGGADAATDGAGGGAAMGGPGARFAVAFGASGLTHPVVWFVLPQLGLPYWTYVAIAETYAVAVEALWGWRWGLRHAWAWSLLANGLSFGLGMVSRRAFGWP